MNRRAVLKRGAVLGTTLGGLPALSGCVGGLGAPDEAVFTVDYTGEWAGSVGSSGSTRSISGYGSESYTIEDPSIVSGNAQKRDSGSGTLTVTISANGDVKAQTSTGAQYGVAQVSHDF